jgi:DNA polymerase III alpha subunit
MAAIAASELTFDEVEQLARAELAARGLPQVYADRLEFELSEIKKQGAETVWVNRQQEGKKFSSNPNNLVFPWLLGMVGGDPIKDRPDPMLNTVRAAKVIEFKEQNGFVPHDLIKDSDSPDIDIDCLPDARDPIKEYAIERYGQTGANDEYGSVCSVGTWQTYKFKMALTDAAVALGLAPRGHGGKKGAKKTGRPSANYTLEKIDKYTGELPDDVDELKEGGKAACKGKIITEKDGVREEKECKFKHAELRCPKCGSEDTDGPTLAKLVAENPVLQQLVTIQHPEKGEIRLLETAANLVGRIRQMGMHAGAIIVTDRPLYGNIPLAKSGKKGYWTSMWTEGRSTQLSKFGYIKWDLLGLKTLNYIFRCCQFIEQNRGISFGPGMSGWDDISPQERRAGHFFDGDGNKRYIHLDDEHAIRLANELKTDGVFQFDTDLAKQILSNGVKTFEDLMLFNAMGHPGPMASIPEAVQNRDDVRGSWKRRMHPEFLKVLEKTYGVIVYQEQLQALWQNIAGFTSPEAQEARKAVAKKWTHLFPPIEKKWIEGAARKIGREEAEAWWPKMVTFGRYAFNLSHTVSYCLMAHRCLWLKAHFAPEWWAAVMSDCHPEKRVKHMGVARAEGWEPTEITYCGKYKGDGRQVRGVRFGTINIERLTSTFTVTGDVVNQGLVGIKGIGKPTAKEFEGDGTYANIEKFIAVKGAKKTVLERLIKLGAFSHLPGHSNAKALWMWYMYKHCKQGKDKTELRRTIRQQLLEKEGWTNQTINAEIHRQALEYRRQYPKRTKIPTKIKNWKPKPNDSRERVMALFADDFTVEDRLEFQQQYYGFWLDSPLEVYQCSGNCTIGKAKERALVEGLVPLEGIIKDIVPATTKNDKPYLKVFLTDGIQDCLIFIWSNEILMQDSTTLQPNVGVTMMVQYDDKRSTFTLGRGQVVYKLKPRDP